ncbi:hypothetical protein ACHAPJ_001034 [Fusarium lateritium]
MCRVPLTEEQDSEWWEFSVTSLNCHVWIKHCWGQVRGEQDPFPQEEVIKESDKLLLRQVNASKWCDIVSEEGLTYGPTFNTGESNRTSTKTPHQASTTIQNGENRWDDASEYYMHPVVLDTFYQLISCTSTLGIRRNYRRLVASSMDLMTMAHCNDDRVSIEVTSELTEQDLIGSGTVFAGTKPVMRVVNSRSSSFEGGEVGDDTKVLITARCQWVPHIDFKPLSNLIQPPDVSPDVFATFAELSKVLIAQAHQLVGSVDMQVPHLIKYNNWLDKVVDQGLAASGNATLASASYSLFQKLQDDGPSSAKFAAKSLVETSDKLRDLFAQEETGFTELGSSSTLDMGSQADTSAFLRSLGNNKPTIRVLEFYSGSVEATSRAIECLTRNEGTRLFCRYLVATSSLVMPDASSDHLKKLVPDIEIATLDLSQRLADQGLDDRQFDLIITPGIVSSTRNVKKSLESLRSLLSPTGRLLLQEPRLDTPWVHFVLGATQDWWSYEEDDHTEGPLVDPKRLQQDLEASGFADMEQLGLAPRLITVVGPSELVQKLESQGYTIDRCLLEQVPPAGQDIAAVLDEQGPFVESMDATAFAQLKTFINSIQSSGGLLWITRQPIVECQDPRLAQAIGLSRTLRNETTADIAVFGQGNYASANTFLDVFARYLAGMGLPCTSLDLGAMEGIGYLDENQDLLRKMNGTGWRPVREKELAEALNLALMPQSSRQEYGDVFLLGVASTVL